MGCASSTSVLKQNAALYEIVTAIQKELNATRKALTERIVKLENELANDDDVELVVDEEEEEEEEEVSEPVPDKRIHFLNFSW
jgi:hypothetical protein